MAKKFSLLLGIVLLGVGVVGWFTGGHDHSLIIFGINMKHNLVHIASGALALLAGLGGEKYAKMYCIAFGVVYGLVTIAGFLNISAAVQMLNLNMADNFLHLGISVACLGVGVASKPA